jgi:hypothetical protein
MLSNAHRYVQPADEAERIYLESLIREDFMLCHPGETLEDLKRRAAFSKEDKGLLRDWMALRHALGAVLSTTGLQIREGRTAYRMILSIPAGS